jgi:hypothetical protein
MSEGHPSLLGVIALVWPDPGEGTEEDAHGVPPTVFILSFHASSDSFAGPHPGGRRTRFRLGMDHPSAFSGTPSRSHPFNTSGYALPYRTDPGSRRPVLDLPKSHGAQLDSLEPLYATPPDSPTLAMMTGEGRLRPMDHPSLFPFPIPYPAP